MAGDKGWGSVSLLSGDVDGGSGKMGHKGLGVGGETVSLYR